MKIKSIIFLKITSINIYENYVDMWSCVVRCTMQIHKTTTSHSLHTQAEHRMQ